MSGIADEQAGVVEQGEVALGALLGSGANLDEGDAAANSLPFLPANLGDCLTRDGPDLLFHLLFHVIASKKAPQAFRRGQELYRRIVMFTVAALTVGLVRVNAKVGVETEVAHRQGVADIHSTRRLEPSERRSSPIPLTRNGRRRQVELARQLMPVERADWGTSTPIVSIRMNDHAPQAGHSPVERVRQGRPAQIGDRLPIRDRVIPRIAVVALAMHGEMSDVVQYGRRKGLEQRLVGIAHVGRRVTSFQILEVDDHVSVGRGNVLDDAT